MAGGNLRLERDAGSDWKWQLQDSAFVQGANLHLTPNTMCVEFSFNKTPTVTSLHCIKRLNLTMSDIITNLPAPSNHSKHKHAFLSSADKARFKTKFREHLSVCLSLTNKLVRQQSRRRTFENLQKHHSISNIRQNFDSRKWYQSKLINTASEDRSNGN